MLSTTMADVTRILSEIKQGDPAAAEQLLPLVYDELRKLAAARLAHEKPGQTLMVCENSCRGWVKERRRQFHANCASPPPQAARWPGE